MMPSHLSLMLLILLLCIVSISSAQANIQHTCPAQGMELQPDRKAVFYQNKNYHLLEPETEQPFHRTQQLKTINGTLAVRADAAQLWWKKKYLGTDNAHYLIQDYHEKNSLPKIVVAIYYYFPAERCETTSLFHHAYIIDMTHETPTISEDYLPIMIDFEPKVYSQSKVLGLTIKKIDNDTYADGKPLYVTYLYHRKTQNITKQ